MDQRERAGFAQAELLRHLGPSGPYDLVLGGWPVFDSLMAVVIIRDDHPIFISSVLAQALSHHSRFEALFDALPPREQLIEWAAGEFGEDTATSWHRAGRWESLWLGEVDYPVPVSGLSGPEMATLPTEVDDKLAFARALRSGAYASHTKTLVVSDAAGPIETAFELSELLGYEAHDHQWVPERWRTAVVQPGFHWGFEPAVTSGGAEVLLRYYSYRLAHASVYLARVWVNDADVDALELELPPGFREP